VKGAVGNRGTTMRWFSRPGRTRAMRPKSARTTKAMGAPTG